MEPPEWWIAQSTRSVTDLSDDEYSREMKFLHETLIQHPYRVAFDKWRELNMVREALSRMARDVVAIAQAPDSEAVQVQLMSQGNEEARISFTIELYRMLVGYLALFSSLVDQARKLAENYSQESFSIEYAKRSAALRDSGLSRFLKDLRNCLLHSRFAPIAFVMRFEADRQPQSLFTIEMESTVLLEQHQNWSAPARTFLQGREHIVLVDAIAEHEQLLNEELYVWLFEQFPLLHATDRVDLGRYEDRWKRLTPGLQDVLEHGFRSTGQPVDPDNVRGT